MPSSPESFAGPELSLELPQRNANGLLRVPASPGHTVHLRFAPLSARDQFEPSYWRQTALARDPEAEGYVEVDVDDLGLADGTYEYEFVVRTEDGTERAVPDPFAEEITRFGGYRGLFHIRDGTRYRRPFSWIDELPEGQRLPNNNELVVYELPLRWTASASPDYTRQIGLGDLDHLLFVHLDHLASLGINAIELLPIQDSPDTLNWGYGTRFFLAPDYDMGQPVDLKLFIKRCHQRGIRVFLDVVMNHARECPLEDLAEEWFFLRSDEEPERPSWGGRRFRYRDPVNGHHPAREFHYQMAEFWVSEYHVDGFRIDEFKGIDHWAFVQTFRDRAWARHREVFPDRPFLVIAEDSWRRAAAVYDRPGNPNGRKVVDSIWNFAFRDESRRLMRDEIRTEWGQPSRRERIEALIRGDRTWDDWDRRFTDGFGDMAQAVNYLTSHDVEGEGEQRLMNYVFGSLLRERGLGDGSVENVRELVGRGTGADTRLQQAHVDALERVGSAHALLMTSVGIPMVLAGEEFGDVHDLDHTDWRLKMSDPIDWRRRELPGHKALEERVRDLIMLRTSHPALQRNEVEFFYVHPTIDENEGVRVFGYCRTGGRPLGSRDQVIVLANCGAEAFPAFIVPWPWTREVEERGVPFRGARLEAGPHRAEATISLDPFQVRVFAT